MRIGLATLATLALAACAATPVDTPATAPSAPEAPPPGGAVSRFTCDSGETLEAVFLNGGESVRVTIADGEPATLPRIESGSGFTYSSRSTTLTGKGEEVRYQVVGGKSLVCAKAPKG